MAVLAAAIGVIGLILLGFAGIVLVGILRANQLEHDGNEAREPEKREQS